MPPRGVLLRKLRRRVDGFLVISLSTDTEGISEITADGIRTADGRLVFGWGICKDSPGVDYPITYSKHASNDPMHFFIAPGITTKDAAAVIKAMRIATDGTIKPARP